jgi:hypothetical protein
MDAIRLRPHHVLDIVTDFKRDNDPGYRRASGENGVRDVTRMIGKSLDFAAEFVIGPDYICKPCSHLQANGRCDRMLDRFDPPRPIDDYNDPVDQHICDYLGMAPGSVMTIRQFLTLANDHLPGIEEVYAQSRRRGAERRDGLIRGMRALGIRQVT